MFLFAAPSANAADPEPFDTVFDEAKAVSAAGHTLREGPLEVVFTDGALVPMYFGPDKKAVGFVFTGNATLKGTIADRGDAWSLANRQVLLLKQPVADWAAVAHQQAPFTCHVTRGVVVVDGDFTANFLTGTAVTSPTVERSVTTHAADLGSEFDVLHRVRDGEPASELMAASFRCDQRLGYVSTTPGENDQDHWIGLWRDRSSLELPDDLVAVGHDGGGNSRGYTVALAPWQVPPARRPDGGPAWNGVRPIDVDAVVTASPARPVSVGVEVTATYRFEATEALTTLTLSPPRVDRERFGVTAVTLDGAPIAFPPSGEHRDAAFDVPVSIARGATVTVGLTYHDVWPLTARTDLGRSMWPHPVLAEINDAWFPFRVRVSLPQESGINVAITGLTASESDADGKHWLETVTDGRAAPVNASFGEFATVKEASIEGLPQVRVHVFDADRASLPSFPPFVRTIVAYYQGFLPEFPTHELEILQVPDGMSGFTWTARPGLVTLQQMKVYGSEGSVRASQPHLEESVLAHEIAHQWWGGLVDNARVEDGWMIETLAEVYACTFVAAAFGPKDCAVRQEDWRDEWEVDHDRTHVTSLRRARSSSDWTGLAYDYGPYVIGRMLRARLGDEAFFGALDAWARDRADNVASDRSLQAAFEATSGRDLSAFFDTWVESGFVPALTLAWDDHGATVSSDVPFGIYEVPIAIAYADGTKEGRWVTVTDGTGEATFDKAPTTVKLDAQHLVLARKRKVVAR